MKTFALPKIMYAASVMPISKELIKIKEAYSVFYGFNWNGKDKVKCHDFMSDSKSGELRMLDFECLIKEKSGPYS